MTQPAPTPQYARDGAKPKRMSPSSAPTWFRTREGRRYGWEIGFVIVVKLALLLVLWFAVIEPWPRPAPPATVVQQLYLPAVPAARHD